MGKTILGFDIGAGAVKLVQWTGGCVQRVLSVPTPDNMVKNGVILSYAAMADLIKEQLKAERISGRDCALILPGSHTFLRRVTMPAMTEDQLRVNLPYEFRDFLTMGKDKYFYDYAVNDLTRDEAGKPIQMDLTAAAVPKAVIGEYRDMFRRAGLRLRTAIPAECAYANLLRREDAAGRELCFLDLGHTVSRVYFFTGARFETARIIDIGLETVDRAIAEAMGVDEHVARSYKESNYQNCQALESVRNVYHAIAMELRRSINFYGFSNQNSDLQGVWCCGGGVRIPALLDEIRQVVEPELRIADELLPPTARGLDDLAVFPAAVGAAIQ